MMKRRILLSILGAVVVVAMPVVSWAQCTMVVRGTAQPQSGDQYQISWDAVPGASNYTVMETYWPLEDYRFARVAERENGSATAATFSHIVALDTTYNYIVRAYADDNPYDPICAGTASIRINGNRDVEDFVGRAIIPVVGSAPGAYGAQFKTYLRLEGIGNEPIRGKLVFHPAGQPARNTDPSLPYELKDTNDVLEFDDVVAAIGASGIGSLDIVPSGTPSQLPLPEIEVRVYNDAPNGTFGSAENAYLPREVFGDEVVPQRFVYPDARFRLNVGVRTLVPRSKAIVAVYDPNGRLRDAPAKTITFTEAGFYMGTPESLFHVTVQPGDRVVVSWLNPVFPFYTLTENRTNDPFIFVTGTPTRGGQDLAGFRQ